MANTTGYRLIFEPQEKY